MRAAVPDPALPPRSTRTERSGELVATVAPDLELCHQTFGTPTAEPLLLIMGLGGPMTWWDDEFCELLAEQGYFVIRYDNRDSGHSTKRAGRVRLPQLARAFVGLGGRPPYTVADLAEDALGLLDHLGIDSAHVVGMSMGGMIAQTLALEHPARVRSLVSIMSSTGRRVVGWQHPALLPGMLHRPHDRDSYLDAGVRLWRIIGSPGYPTDEVELRTRGAETWDRGVCPAGTARQMYAILTQPDRGPQLQAVTAPTLVIHGLSDKMVHPSGGRETSRRIPGSELILVPGMGHDLPRVLWPAFARAIDRNAHRHPHRRAHSRSHRAAGS